ncbi:MAG: esterase, partial [Planctomycetes bacterium]|nr:esterase [Planctomycetota bacterium]
LDWFQVENLTEHNGMRPLFGIDGLDDLEKPHVKALIKEASPLTHLTKDDPPVFMTYGGPDRDVTETTPPGTWVHHPRFGIRLKEIMDKMKMESHLKYPGAPEIKKYESGIDFIIKKLKK